MSVFGRSTQFERTLEKATSQLLLEPDWDSTLQICDLIRQSDVQPKYAVSAVKKRIAADNPHVSMFAVQVLEAMMKNCGATVHVEVATRDFMEFFKEQANKRPDPVKSKILELIQVWAHAFRNEPQYKIVQDTMTLLKVEGHTFPSLRVSDAMFSSEKAPEWKDGETCLRCRVQFGSFTRKHHCRACGNIFCARCSSKSTIIPKFGIEKEVRVCEGCYDELSKQPGGAKKSAAADDQLPAEYLSSPLSQQPQTPAKKTEQELQEEEELQLAIALSQSEEEEKAKQSRKKGGNYGTTSKPVESTQVKTMMPMIDMSDMDPELARYLNRNYWEQKQVEIGSPSSQPLTTQPSTTQPSAPVVVSEPKTVMVRVEEKYQNGETDDESEFLNALRSSIEIFINRMKSNSQRSRSIANDSSVQTLFMTINAMHPRLMQYIADQEDARARFETLQDKLAQLKDAREALDVLREEHLEKKRREQEELERQRQIQMAQALTVLRQKKQEYLEYQRQLAVQRMREQEHEMAMRMEQQKQLHQMRAMSYSGVPYQPQQMYAPGQAFSPGTSPRHQTYLPQGMPPGDVNSPPGVYNPAMYPGQMVQPGGYPMPQPAQGMRMPQPGPMMPGASPVMQPMASYSLTGLTPEQHQQAMTQLPQGQTQVAPGPQQLPPGQPQQYAPQQQLQQIPQQQQMMQQPPQQLPQEQQQLPQQQQQLPPQQQQLPQQQQQLSQQQQQLPQQQQQLPQQQQQLPQQPGQQQQQPGEPQQPQPGQTEATLISFD